MVDRPPVLVHKASFCIHSLNPLLPLQLSGGVSIEEVSWSSQTGSHLSRNKNKQDLLPSILLILFTVIVNPGEWSSNFNSVLWESISPSLGSGHPSSSASLWTGLGPWGRYAVVIPPQEEKNTFQEWKLGCSLRAR